MGGSAHPMQFWGHWSWRVKRAYMFHAYGIGGGGLGEGERARWPLAPSPKSHPLFLLQMFPGQLGAYGPDLVQFFRVGDVFYPHALVGDV
jgi:hypothetical protein